MAGDTWELDGTLLERFEIPESICKTACMGIAQLNWLIFSARDSEATELSAKT